MAPVSKSLGEPAQVKQAKAEPVLQMASVDESVSANCGAANGLLTETKPATDFVRGRRGAFADGRGALVLEL